MTDPVRPGVVVAPGSSAASGNGVRRLQDLPDPQAYIAPGATGLYTRLADQARTGAAPDLRAGRTLRPYQPYASPNTPADPARYNIGQIVVKFREGSGARIEAGRLELAASAAGSGGRNLLRGFRQRLEAAELRVRLSAPGVSIGRATPQVEPAMLDLLRRQAEAATGTWQADPNLFFHVYLQTPDAARAADLLKSLRRLRSVEAAYFQPIPANAADIPPTTSIDVTPQQGYFRPAPLGVDVDFARGLAGGRGEGVRIVDVEGGWVTDHEDLPPVSFGYGINFAAFDGDHGTAVLGEIAAQENGFGANGIAPNAMIGWSSFTNIDPIIPVRTYFYSVANALLSAGLFLRAGDIALIEQHFPNPLSGPCPNTCNCSQFGYVAVETMPYEHAAISWLTAVGVIVVEAGGNGQTLVTPALPTDSGAIVVGASNGNRTAACFTNFGPRVNVHAWGGGIGSLGYANLPVLRRDAAGNVVLGADGLPIVDTVPDSTLRANGADARQFYTRSFGGTSGASPIVVGSAALIQGIRLARGLDPLNSVQMRTLLASTGTPQVGATGGVVIGPQPNLRAAIGSFVPDAAAFVRQTAAPVSISPGATFSVTATFRNTGGAAWSAHTLAIAPSDAGAFPWGTTSFVLGTPAASINPGTEVTRVFTVQAPAQPGTYQLAFVLRSAAGDFLASSPRQAVAVTAGNALFDNATLLITSTPGSLRTGQSALVTVTATNTGSSTWDPTHHRLSLVRTGRLALPQNNAPAGTVGPGQTQAFTFTVMCGATQGLGGFSAQMSGPNGLFGQGVGANIACQP